MATLYELTDDLLKLYEMAADPEIDEEILKDTIEGVGGEIEVKADGYAKVIKEIDGDIATVKAEIDRLSKKRKAMENSKDRIKNSLETAMKATGKVKFKTDLFSFNIQKNPAKLELAEDANIETVPPEYWTLPEPTLDKTKIKEALKEGKELYFAKLVQEESLRIK